jgi:hypothetical protein
MRHSSRVRVIAVFLGWHTVQITRGVVRAGEVCCGWLPLYRRYDASGNGYV